MATMAIKNKKLIFTSCPASSSRNKEILKLTNTYLISSPSIRTNFNFLIV